MALGAYGSELARGNVLQDLARPQVANPLAAISGAVQTAGGITDLRQKQFNLQQAQLQPVYQSMRMLAATNSNPKDDDVLAALGGAARNGGNPDGVVQNYSDWTARGGKPADFVRAYSLGGMSPENQAQLGLGGMQDVNTGTNLVSGTRGGILSAHPGQFTPTSSIKLGLTPGQAATFQTVTGPDGRQYQVPLGTLFGGAGGGGGGGGGGPGGGPGTSASAAINNFGNIRAPSGGFASYATPQDGIAAMASNLTAYQDQHGINTLNGITARWAPVGDGANDPVAYANTISKLTGIDPNAKLDLHDPGTLAKIIPVMAQVEHGRPMGVSGDVLSAGINAGLSGGPGGGGGGGGGPPAAGPFVGATSAQPVVSGAPVQPPVGGPPVQPPVTGGPPVQPPVSGGPPVQPAAYRVPVQPPVGAPPVQQAGGGGMPSYDQTGRPMGQGGGGGGGYGGGGGGAGGGFQMPGVQRGPGGAPILTPPAPWMGPIWEQSAKQYSADVDKEGGLAMRIQPFQSALSIMRANPDLKTGPTSQQWNAWASTLQQYGVSLPSMPADSVTAYQELGKNLARGLVAANAASSQTDMARLEAEASMPSTQMTPDTIRQLVARQIGYERFQVARLQYFRTLHPGEDPDQYANQYRSQTSQWASKLDPVAFGADNMTDQDIATYLKGLSPAEQQNFRRSIGEASKLFPDVARAGQ